MGRSRKKDPAGDNLSREDVSEMEPDDLRDFLVRNRVPTNAAQALHDQVRF